MPVPGSEGAGRPRQQGGDPCQEDGRRIWRKGEPHHNSVHRGGRGGQQVRRPVAGTSQLRDAFIFEV